MYLHLGNGVVVRKSEVLGVFDLDNTSASHITRKYLSQAEKENRVVSVAEGELPKSFVVCATQSGQKIYLCQLNSSTIGMRFARSDVTA